MKILHTSDWHLGHRLLEQAQFEEQSMFLGWLKDYIADNLIDVLLVAGDVFDTGAPSAQSLKLYYDFLLDLRQTNCKHIVITGGNHDAPGTLNAPKELLQSLSIHVVGKAIENVEEEVFELMIDKEKVIVAAVPYLRDQDIRRAIAGENFDQIGDRYKTALVNHYTEVADYCESINKGGVPLVAMGHLFAIGGSTSDSEKSIYVGNIGDIKAADFPEGFDYIALGHLHRSQTIGKLDHVRYSGSPYILSFSEVDCQKNVVVITAGNSGIKDIEEVRIPRFRDIARIRGSLQECLDQLLSKEQEKHELTPWVEVVLDKNEVSSTGFQEISKVVDNLNLEVLKVTLKKDPNTEGIEKWIKKSSDLKELSPTEVFKHKCEEQGFDLDENAEILDAFHEILQLADNS